MALRNFSTYADLKCLHSTSAGIHMNAVREFCRSLKRLCRCSEELDLEHEHMSEQLTMTTTAK